MNGNLSAPQLGKYGVPPISPVGAVTPQIKKPLPVSSATNSSFGAKTAWGIERDEATSPISLSAQTAGSTFRFPTAEEQH